MTNEDDNASRRGPHVLGIGDAATGKRDVLDVIEMTGAVGGIGHHEGVGQVFTREPTDMRRLAALDQVAALPDGTVVIWSDDDVRQSGVLETEDGRGRVVRPISIGRYEDDWHLGAVVPPVWVVTFDDPPAVR